MQRLVTLRRSLCLTLIAVAVSFLKAQAAFPDSLLPCDAYKLHPYYWQGIMAVEGLKAASKLDVATCKDDAALLAAASLLYGDDSWQAQVIRALGKDMADCICEKVLSADGPIHASKATSTDCNAFMNTDQGSEFRGTLSVIDAADLMDHWMDCMLACNDEHGQRAIIIGRANRNPRLDQIHVDRIEGVLKSDKCPCMCDQYYDPEGQELSTISYGGASCWTFLRDLWFNDNNLWSDMDYIKARDVLASRQECHEKVSDPDGVLQTHIDNYKPRDGRSGDPSAVGALTALQTAAKQHPEEIKCLCDLYF